MKIGKACAVFMQIDNEKYTAEEKGTAIYEVLKMPTHNGITKAAMLRVIGFLLNLAYEAPKQNGAEALGDSAQAAEIRGEG